MASALTDTAKSAWAAHASSGGLGTPASSVTGKPDSTDVWQRVREQASRALVSDPDTVFYLLFLASNRAYKTAAPLSAQLDALALAAEGAAFTSVEVTVPSPDVGFGESVSADTIQTTVAALTQRAASAATASKLGKRKAVRGDEARKEYVDGLDPFLLAYRDLRAKLVWLSNSYPFSFEGYRNLALKTPISRATAALAATHDPATSSSFVAQNAAAAAALTALSGVPQLDYRLKYDQAFSPETAELVFAGATGTFTKSSPSALFIRVGDELRTASGVASVVSVDTSSITLSSSAQVTGAFSITPASLPALKTLVSNVTDFLTLTPDVTSSLREGLLRLGTAADVNKVILQLAQLQGSIGGLSSTMTAVLTRRGVEPPERTSLQAALLAYAPSLPKKTRDSALAIVDALENNGFSYAASCVLSANTSVLLGEAGYPGSSIK